jgi:hypothetical protein
MAADIAVESQRSGLIERQGRERAPRRRHRAYALEATLKHLREMDWRTLMAVSSGKLDAKTSIAMAFRDLAENAQKIGQLNISPDLLETLLQRDGADGAEPSQPQQQQQTRGRKQ